VVEAGKHQPRVAACERGEVLDHGEGAVAEYAKTSGNRGAWMLRRDEGDRTKFITLSLWDSVDAIRAFAGDDIKAAVLYPEDERYLVGGGSTVTHYQIVDQVQPASGSGERA
jgi:heme-degrading monooxygenase HmoA